MEHAIRLGSPALTSPRISLSAGSLRETRSFRERPEISEKEDISEKERGESHTGIGNGYGSTEKDVVVNNGLPFPVLPNEVDEPMQCTIRALIVGSLLGAVVGASNIYLGLKTGFTFGGSLFGSMLGYAICRGCVRFLPLNYGGRPFGPKENCALQTTASSAGGLTSLFVAAVPAMYRLGLLDIPKTDYGRHLLLTAVTSFYGFAFAIPLRSLYIIRQQLTFPSPFAVAVVLRSLHSATGKDAARDAIKKTWILLIAMAVSFVWIVVGEYCRGILLQFHFFWFIGTPIALAAESWGWFWEWSPAFFGSGLLVGLNATLSLLAGTIFCWGILGPLLVSSGIAFGKPSGVSPLLTNYMSMKVEDVNVVSPRFWLLWPGIAIMFTASLAEVAMFLPAYYRTAAIAYQDLRNAIRVRRHQDKVVYTHCAARECDIVDPTPPKEQVPFWAWGGSLLLTAIVTILVCKFFFYVHPGLVILALILGFLFAFVGCNASGQTDVNPVGSIAKGSQLIFAGISRSQGVSLKEAQLTNLVLGSVVGQAASNSVDMIGDLKTGFLLRASPRALFYSQMIGALFGMPLAVGLFTLFASAYPCIITPGENCAAFGMTAVVAWEAVADLLTRPDAAIPRSSLICTGASAGATLLVVLTKHFLISERYKIWVPNMNSIGLAFILYQTHYSLMMVLGAVVGYIWQTCNPTNFEFWAFALSAGMIAGEGLGGVWNALATIAGFGGEIHGVGIGCPGNSC